MLLDCFNVIRIVLLVIVLVFVCVSTGVKWFKLDALGGDIKYFLYGVKTGSGSVVKYKDVTCAAVHTRMNAAYAFAIISCIVVGFALICVIAQLCVTRQARMLTLLSLALSIFAFATTLIAWAIGVGFYHGTFCGSGVSAKDGGVDIVEGLALMIVAWILLLFDVIVGIVKFAHYRDPVVVERKEPVVVERREPVVVEQRATV